MSEKYTEEAKKDSNRYYLVVRFLSCCITDILKESQVAFHVCVSDLMAFGVPGQATDSVTFFMLHPNQAANIMKTYLMKTYGLCITLQYKLQ